LRFCFGRGAGLRPQQALEVAAHTIRPIAIYIENHCRDDNKPGNYAFRWLGRADLGQAGLQDTRDLFAFDRLVLDPDGDARVTRHLLYFDRIVLLESGMLRELDKEQWLDELN